MFRGIPKVFADERLDGSLLLETEAEQEHSVEACGENLDILVLYSTQHTTFRTFYGDPAR